MELEILPRDLLGNFDVGSFFTNIPREETLEIVKNEYNQSGYVIYLTRYHVKNTNFIFKEQGYKQTEVTPMGLALSLILANLFM